MVDLRPSYAREIGLLGRVAAALATTYYDKYEYTDLSGTRQVDVLPVSGGFESRLQDPFGRQFYLEVNYESGAMRGSNIGRSPLQSRTRALRGPLQLHPGRLHGRNNGI